MERVLTAAPEDAGLRLDAFLALRLPDFSRSRIQHHLDLPEPAEADPEPEEIPLDILFEDEDLLVINKPKGMVVHPAPGHESGTLVNALLHHCGDSLSGIGGVKRPGIVHRLDKDTSGLMLAAKTDRAHASLAAQLGDHSLHRVYAALLIGTPRPAEGVVDLPVGRHPRDRKKMAAGVPGGRSAVTRYRVLESFPGYSYAECVLETGRTHQIRVHMASLGHPVAGDPLYGGKCALPLSSQCLHAREICFRHPVTGEDMTFSCPLPPEFSAVLQKLRDE